MFLLLAVAVWILLLLLVEVVVHGYVTFLATGAMMGTERGTDGCCFCGGDDTVDVANSFSATGAGAAGLGVLAATGAPDTPDVAGLGVFVVAETPVDDADADCFCTVSGAALLFCAILFCD